MDKSILSCSLSLWKCLGTGSAPGRRDRAVDPTFGRGEHRTEQQLERHVRTSDGSMHPYPAK
eukprot:3874521-Rhodomonas_salina.11